jgi:hypothetical protein
MKTLTLALVLVLFGFGEAGADDLGLYCVELRPCPQFRGITMQLYSWSDYDLLHVGDIVRVDLWNITSNQASCGAGYQQYQHRTTLLSSCTGSFVSTEGWMFFESDRSGEKFEVISIDPWPPGP